MKNLKFSLLVAAASAASMTGSLPAATYYWDVNGTNSGATDATDGTAQGVWNNSATSPYWNSNSTGGAGALSFKTTTADEVRFSAGVNATGAFLVYVAGDSANAADGETIVAAQGSVGHVTQNGQQNIGRIFFEEGAVTLKKGIIYLGDATTLGVGNQALIANNSTANATILATLKGAADGLTIGGTGRTVFGLDNTYTGATTIASGATLQIQSTQSLSTTAVTVQSGGTLELATGITTFANALNLSGTGVGNGGALRAVSGSTNIYTGTITLGAGGARINADTGELRLTGGIIGGGNSLTVGGAGNTRIMTTTMNLGAGGLNKDGDGTLFIAQNSTYTGLTTISRGIVNIGTNQALGTGAAVSGQNTVTSGGSLQLQGGITVNQSLALSGFGTFTDGTNTTSNNDGALRNVSGNNTYNGALSLSGGTTRINSDTGTLTLGGAITGAGQNLLVGGSGNTVANGVVNLGTGSIIKDGSGTLTLNNNNVLTGPTAATVSNGTLVVGNRRALGSDVTGTVPGGTVYLGDANTGANNVELKVLTTGNPNFGPNHMFNNAIVTGGGTGTITITGVSSPTTNPPGVGFNGTFTLNRATIIKADSWFDVIAGTIQGNVGALTYLGSGIATPRVSLNGNNTYVGTTIVGDGVNTMYVQGGSSTAAGVGNAMVIQTGSTFANVQANMTIGSLNGNGTLQYLDSGTRDNGSFTLQLNAGESGAFSGLVGGLPPAAYGLSSFNATDFRIIKTGAGTQVLSGIANNYVGSFGGIFATHISGGILEIKKIANGGAASSIGASTNVASNLILNGGASGATLRYTGTGATDGTTDRLFTLGNGANAGILDASGASGSPLVFTNTGAISLNQNNPAQNIVIVGGTRRLTLTGSNTDANSLALILGDNGGATELLKSGTGTWVVSGSNTYTGDTLVNAGKLRLDYSVRNNSKLSNSGALRLGGGTLELSGGTHNEVVGSTELRLNSKSTITRTGGATGTIALGAITPLTGSALNIVTDDLAASSTVASTTTANGADGILGGWCTLNGTDFAMNSGVAGPAGTTGNYIRAFSGLTQVADGGTISDNGNQIWSMNDSSANNTGGPTSGAAIVLGAATTNVSRISQDQTAGGTTLVDIAAGQTLRLGVTGGILMGSGANALTIGTAPDTGNLSAGGSTAGTAGTLYLDNSSINLLTVNSKIVDNGTGVVTVTKAGSGKAVLNGANTYTGATVVTQGILGFDDQSALGSSSTVATNLVLSGGVLQYTGSVATTSSRLFSVSTTNGGIDSSAPTAGGNSIVFTNTGAMGFNGQSGSRTLILSGTNTNDNTLAASIGDNAGATSLIKGGGTAFSGGTTGVGGVWLLSGANTYSGGTTVNDGTLKAGVSSVFTASAITSGAFGTGGLTIATGATVNLNGFDTATGNLSGAGSLVLGANKFATGFDSANTTFSGVINGVGGQLEKDGQGTLTLSGASTYAGATTVNGGVLQAGVATVGGSNPTSGAFGVNSAVTVGAAGSLDFANFNETLGSLSGQGGVSMGSGNMIVGTLGTSAVYNGILSGTGNVTKVGTGTWTVNGVNTYTGTTTVSVGAIRMQGAQAMGVNTTASAVIVGSGAALELDGGFTTTGAQPLTISGDGTSAGTGALRNIIGNNTWTGLVTLAGNSRINSDAGTLILANGQNLAVGVDTLSLGGAGGMSIRRSITGTGGLTVDGTGTVTIDGTNGGTAAAGTNVGNGAYTGTTKVSSGTFRLLYNGANDLLNAGSSLNMNGGTVVFENLAANTQTFASTTITGGTSLAPSRLVLGAGRTTGIVNLGSMSQQNIFSMDVSNMGYDPTKSWVRINNATGVLNVTTDYGITGNNGVDVLSSDATGRLFIALTDDYSREGQISTGAVTARLIQTGLGTNIGGRAISLINPTTTARTEIQSLQNSYTAAAAVPDNTILLYLRANGTRANNYADGQNGTLRLGATNSASPVNSSITSTAGTNLLIDYGTLTVGGYATLGGAGSSGGNISFNTAADALGNGGLITLGANMVLADNSPIVGTNAVSISKIGTGTLNILGANTYSGLTTVSAGVMNLQSNGGLGGTANGTTVAAGAALQLQNNITVTGEALTLNGTGVANDGALRNISDNNTWGGAITLASASRINSDAGTLTLSGAIGGAGQNLTLGGAGNTLVSGIIGTGAGTLIKDGAGTATLSGANTYTGLTTVGAGVLNIQSGTALGTAASGTTVTSGAALQLQNNITVAGEALTLNGTGIADDGALRNVGGANTYGGAIILGSDSRINSDATSTLTLSGAVANGGNLLTLGGAGDTVVSGIISGTGALTKDGAGVATISSSGTYVGITSVNAGTLAVTGSIASATVNIGTGATLAVSNGIAIADTASVTSSGTGAFVLNTSETIGSLAGSGTVNLGANTLNTGGDGTSTAYAGVISGTVAGGLNKTGAGVFTLTGANNYLGATNVNAGGLYINGDQTAATGLTTVNAGTLGGTGTIGGSVVVANGGTLSPGDNSTAPGMLTIKGGLTLNNTSHLAYSFGQAGVVGGSLNDLVNVGGALTLDGVLDVTLAPGGTFGPGIYRIMNYTGALTNNTLAVGAVPSGTSVSDIFVQTSVANQVNLVNSAGLTLQFWEGTSAARNDGVVSGGSGVWQASGAGANDNWTVASGTPNAPYAANAFAIFQGVNGAVSVDSTSFGAVRSSGMQFVTSGYTLVANAAGDRLTLVETSVGSGMTTIKVGDGTAAGSTSTTTINVELTGSSGLSKEDLGTLVLGGTNTYTGGTAIKAGTLAISNNNNLGAAAGGLSFDTGTLKTLASVASSRAVTLNAGGGIVDTNGFDSTLGGTVGGVGSITKVGAGVLTLSATNSYAGGTAINGGVLAISTDANLGAAAGALSFDGGTLRTLVGISSNRSITLSAGDGTVDTNAVNSTLGGGISGTGGLTKIGAGTLSLTAANTYAGLTTVSAGTLQVGDGGSTGTLGAGNVLNNSVLAFNRDDSALSVGGVIGGSGLVNQVGSGTTTLTGTNNYTGATNVRAGSLFINGNQAGATGLTTVSSGATLGGSGTIGGSVDMTAGGTLTPGSDAGATGTLTINGSLTLGSTSNLKFSFGQADTPGGPLNDLVNVGANLALDGTIDVSQTAGGSFGPGVYRIFNYTGSLTDNGLAVTSAPVGNLADVYVQTSVANRVNLVNTTGLSFNYWDGAAGPKFNGAVNGGDGVWQRTPSNENWTSSTGTVNGPYLDSSFAIFEATPGTVTVNTSTGAVNSAGMQFAVGGYRITGDEVTLVGTQAFIRVGDGTGAGAAMTATIDSVLGGGAQVVKTDLGTLVLAGTNTYTGGTAFNGGVLAIASDANLGAASGALSFDGGTLKTLAAVTTNRAVTLNAGGGTVDTNNFDSTLGGGIAGTGGLTKVGAGTLSLTGAGTYSGVTTVSDGTLQIGAGGTAGSLTGNVLNNSVLAFNRSDSLTYGGTINGTGVVNKLGNGDTILTGSNAYTGATNVNGGGLYINGDQSSATGLTTVNTGGTLGGGGIIGGSVVVADGAILAPGSNTSTPGMLTIKGNLALSNTSALAYSFGQAGVVGGPLNDLVNVGGNLTLDGVINVTLAPGGTFDLGVYRIMNYTGALTDNTLTVGAVPGGVPANVFVQTSVANQVNLVNTAGLALRFWDGATAVSDASLPGGTRKNNSQIEGGDGVWQGSTAGANDNWTESGTVNAPYSNDAFAVFQGAPGTVKVDSTAFGPVTSTGMQFAVSGYIINNNTGSDSITFTGSQNIIRVGDGSAASSGMTATINATLGGIGAQLVKTDLGTLVLGGVNTYTGGTAINAGTLAISNDNNLGDATGALSFDGGTLKTLAAVTSTRGITVNALGGTVNTNGFDSAFNGVISGSGLLTLTGGNVVTLGGNNTNTGGLAVNGGTTVAVTSDGNLGGASNVLTLDNGTLKTLAGITATHAIAIGAGTGTVNTNGFDSALNGAISGTGLLTLTGGNVVTLGGTNLNTGGLTVNGGTTVAASTNANLGGASNVLTLDSGTLRAGAGFTSSHAMTLGAGNGTVDTNGFTLVQGGDIDGAGSLTKTGAGTLTLAGAATHTGGTTVSAGTLQIGNGLTSGSLAGDVQIDATTTLAFKRSDTLTHDGLIQGDGAVDQVGSGTTILTGTNTYTGATNVRSGGLFINGDQTAATALTTVSPGATLGGSGTIGGSVDMTAGGTLAPGSNLGSTGALTIKGNLLLGSTTTLAYGLGVSGVVGGPLNDLVTVTGNLTLDGTINVTESAGGTFAPGVYRVFDYSGTLTNNGLTVGSVPAGNNAAQVFVQTALANQVNLVNASGLTLRFWDGNAGGRNDGTISGGDGTWQNVSGNDNWTTDTGSANAPFTDGAYAVFQAAPGVVTVDTGLGPVTASGMQFAVDGYSVVGNDLTLTGTQAIIRVGDGSLDDNTKTATITANLIGAAQLVKTDAGTLVLGGTNTYTGGTAINAGTLAISNDNNLGAAAGGLSFDGGTLRSDAAITTNRAVTLNAGGGTVDTLGFTDTLNGAIGGTGGLTKSGTGTLVLTADNNYAGTTTISDGTLQIGDGGTTGSLGSGDVTNAAALVIDRDGTLDLGNGIHGTGTLTLSGPGAVTLSGVSDYTGATTVNAGSLNVTGTLGNTAVTVNSGGTLTGSGSIAGTVDIALGGHLANTQGVTLSMGSPTNAVTLAAGANTDVTLSAASTTALFKANGDLTLDGSLNVTGAGAFGGGVYRLFDYTGALTDGGFALGTLTLPSGSGLTLSDLYIDTSHAGQVNLINTYSVLRNVWDGPTDIDHNNGSVQGGSGEWNASATNRNWTNDDISGGLAAGAVNNTFGVGAPVAIFRGTAGTVTVNNGFGQVQVGGLQFETTGYTISGGAITLVNDATTGVALLKTDSGVTATIGSVLQGSANVVKLGTGTMMFAADNTYTGTTTVAAGTLQVGNGGSTGSLGSGSVVNDASLVFNRSGAYTVNNAISGSGTVTNSGSGQLTFSGVISGSNSLVQSAGAGQLTLTGNNTYTGTTDIASGTTLQVGVGGNSGSLGTGDINLGTGATLVFNRSDFLEVNGQVVAADVTSTLVQRGSGTTILAANSVYGGRIIIEDGVLQVGKGAAAGTTLTGYITVDPGAKLTFNRSDETTVTAKIDGTGDFIQNGVGKTIVTGDTSGFTGQTTVNHGTLELNTDASPSVASLGPVTINADGTLMGTGTIRGPLHNFGTLSIGHSPGALNVVSTSGFTGDFINHAGSFYNEEIGGTPASGLFDVLNVTGTATIEGGSLRVLSFGGYNPVADPSVRYRIISAAGGVVLTDGNNNGVSGFDNVVGGVLQNDNFAALKVMVEYGANFVDLYFQFDGLKPTAELLGLTPNMISVAGGLDDAATANPAFGALVSEVAVLDNAGFARALASLSPQGFERLWDNTRYNAVLVNNAVESRLQATDRVNPDENIWMQVIRRVSQMDGDMDIAAGSAQSNGVIIGADKAFGSNFADGDKFTVGAMFEYSNDDVDMGLGSRSRVNRYLPGLYARYKAGDAFVEAVGSWGYADYSSKRSVDIGADHRVAKSHTESDERSASVRAGYEFHVLKDELGLSMLNFAPYAGFMHTRWDADGFTESGAGLADLSVHDMKAESTASRLGLIMNSPIPVGDLVFVPKIDVAWRHEFQQSRRDITANFGPAPFTVRTMSPATDAVEARAGLDIRLNPRTTLYADFGTFWDGSHGHSEEYRLGVNVKF